VEDLEEDFFSFQPSKPTVPAGGGVAKPRAGRRAGGSADEDVENASNNKHGNESGGGGVGNNANDESNVGVGYLPGVGRGGQPPGRRGVIGGQRPQSEDAAPTMLGREQPLMGRRATPPVEQDFQPQQPAQQHHSSSPAQDHAPALGVGGYVPSMGRRGRGAGGGLLGLGVGGGGGESNNQMEGGMVNANNNCAPSNNENSRGYAPSMMGNQGTAPAPENNQYGAGPGTLMQQPPMHQQQQYNQQPSYQQQQQTQHEGTQQQYNQQQPHQQQQQYQYPGQEQQHMQDNEQMHPAPAQNAGHALHQGIHHQNMPQQGFNQEGGAGVRLNNYGGGGGQQAAMQSGAQIETAATKAPGGSGFKFKFGAKGGASVHASTDAPPKTCNAPSAAPSAIGMHAGSNQQVHHSRNQEVHHSPALQAPGGGGMGRALSPEMPGPAVRGSNQNNANRHSAAGAGPSEASRMSHDSVASTAGGHKIPGASPADVNKSKRLQKLEQELAGMAVTQELQNAYIHPNGRNRRPRSAPPPPSL